MRGWGLRGSGLDGNFNLEMSCQEIVTNEVLEED